MTAGQCPMVRVVYGDARRPQTYECARGEHVGAHDWTVKDAPPPGDGDPTEWGSGWLSDLRLGSGAEVDHPPYGPVEVRDAARSPFVAAAVGRCRYAVRMTGFTVTRDVLVSIASLCVIVVTVLLFYVWARVGQAFDQVGDVGRVPAVQCSPTPEWPC